MTRNHHVEESDTLSENPTHNPTNYADWTRVTPWSPSAFQLHSYRARSAPDRGRSSVRPRLPLFAHSLLLIRAAFKSQRIQWGPGSSCAIVFAASMNSRTHVRVVMNCPPTRTDFRRAPLRRPLKHHRNSIWRLTRLPGACRGIRWPACISVSPSRSSRARSLSIPS
jgi:hypothetical protein